MGRARAFGTRSMACAFMMALVVPAAASAGTPRANADATPGTGSQAAQCAANFKESGDPRNGAEYSSFIEVPNLNPRSALGQMEKFALDEKFSLGAESYADNAGTLTLIQKDQGFMNHTRGFPLVVGASGKTGRLAMAFRLNRGQTTTDKSARGVICGMLSKVRMDAAGRALAARMHEQTHNDAVVNITARDLSLAVQHAMVGHALDPDIVGDEFIGRSYRLDGQMMVPSGAAAAVDRMADAQSGTHSLTLMYDTSKGTAPGEVLGFKHTTSINVECHTDPQQEVRFCALRNHDYATLIAKVTAFNYSAGTLEGTLVLDCHYAA